MSGSSYSAAGRGAGENAKSATNSNHADGARPARPAGCPRRHRNNSCDTMTLRRIIELALCYAVASVAGYLFSLLDLPLPWMIGPLIATALIGLVVKPIDIPTRTRPIGQVMISAHVGLAFNAAALTAILDHGVTILCVAVATAMIGFLMSGVLRRMKIGRAHV